MKNKSHTITFLSIFVVSAVILAGLYAYLLVSLLRIGEEQRDFAGEIKNADNIFKEESDNRESLKRFFLVDGAQAVFVSDLEAACRDFKLECDNRSLGEAPSSNPTVKLFVVNLSAEGSYESVMGLLAYFETSMYPIEITQSAYFAKEPEKATTEWEGVFEFSVPVLIQQ